MSADWNVQFKQQELKTKPRKAVVTEVDKNTTKSWFLGAPSCRVWV